MSEPTYRVDLIHYPANGSAVQWGADITRVATDELIMCVHAATREAAFDNAQEWVKAQAAEPERSSTVYLTEDGDILDPHEVQR